MRFADPVFLGALVVPAAVLVHRWIRRKAPPSGRLAFPALVLAARLPQSLRARWRHLPATFAVAGLVLLVLALARPQVPGAAEPTKAKSRNIMLVLDISSSMKAQDFKPNRLHAAKIVMREFIKRRQGDLMGLVIFAGKAFLQAPLTNDVEVLDRLVDQAEMGLLPDGTAIGTALALGVAQLKELPRNSGVVVLITDGANNTGQPGPLQAAEAARALGIRVHAIGLSSADTSNTWLNGVWSVRTLSARLSGRDEAALKTIAARTGGQYYRASDPEALEQIMAEIDPLERIEVNVSETRRWHELFPWFVAIGLILTALGTGLDATWLRRVP